MTFISTAEHPALPFFSTPINLRNPINSFAPNLTAPKGKIQRVKGKRVKGERAYPKRGFPSSFELQVRWLSSLTPVTYLCTLLGIHCVAAFLQLELFWRYLTAKLFYPPAAQMHTIASRPALCPVSNGFLPYKASKAQSPHNPSSSSLPYRPPRNRCRTDGDAPPAGKAYPSAV